MNAQHPKPEELRRRAADVEARAQGVSDSSEYPRVAKMTCAWQSEALRKYAAAVEQYGDAAAVPKTPGMTGEERRARRAAGLRIRAARLKAKAADLHRASHDIGSRIPFGQPILVGHHSERGHRRAVDRMHNTTGKAIEAENYAKSLEGRAACVEKYPTILTSDGDAVEQYERKLACLERERETMKAENAAWRRFEKSGNPAELVSMKWTLEQVEAMKTEIAKAYSWEKQPHPSWRLSNRGATIRDVKNRLARAKEAKTSPAVQMQGADGIRFEDAPAENRVRLFFPGKPSAEVRTELKRAGFRWAPSLGCWQAYRGQWNLEKALKFAGVERVA